MTTRTIKSGKASGLPAALKSALGARYPTHAYIQQHDARLVDWEGFFDRTQYAKKKSRLLILRSNA